MFRAQQFRWLPNALTMTRLVLAVPIGAMVFVEAWTIGLILLLIALATDFLDGLAAKKLNAQTELGAKLDPVADSSLVIVGFGSLALGGYFPAWLTLMLFVLGGLVGNKRLFWPRPGILATVRSFLSVVGLILAWTYLAWTFATLAFGWSWWYVAVTAAVVVGSALLKRHRLRAWVRRGQDIGRRLAKSK